MNIIHHVDFPKFAVKSYMVFSTCVFLGYIVSLFGDNFMMASFYIFLIAFVASDRDRYTNFVVNHSKYKDLTIPCVFISYGFRSKEDDDKIEYLSNLARQRKIFLVDGKFMSNTRLLFKDHEDFVMYQMMYN